MGSSYDKEIIACLHFELAVIKGDDGYFYWWPTPNLGCYSAHDLRTLADELDRRNAEWDAQVNRESK